MPAQRMTSLLSNLPRSIFKPHLLALALCTLVLAACGKSGAGGAPASAPPPAQVGVITVSQGDVSLTTELPGRLEASRTAQVRARAAGILQKRLFREGSDVTAGQALFSIDPAPYAALVASAKASQVRAEANEAQATSLAERYKPLVLANAVSKQEYANAVAAQKIAQADVAVAKASVQTASINLAYSNVTAPIAGRIGRALVTEGALVGQGEATQLAMIQQTDPMYVNFTQSAADVMQLRKSLAGGQLKQASGAQAASIRVVLEDGSVYPLTGRLLFSDLSVDQTSGQITLRAEVPNPKGILLPGLYVRVRIEQAQASNAVTLPQQAVTRSGTGDTVMIVDANGKVSPRSLKLGDSQNGRWVVLGGLKNGEQVMVDGFQKLRPGATVQAVPFKPIAATGETVLAPAAGAASASVAAK